MSLSVQAVPYKAILLWAAYEGTITEVLRRRGNMAKPRRKSSEILGVEINPFRSLRGFERNRDFAPIALSDSSTSPLITSPE
jgi:hypothetical protein